MKTTKKHRREEAEARQARRDRRTGKEQLRALEARGHGHCKEAKRLRAIEVATEEAMR